MEEEVKLKKNKKKKTEEETFYQVYLKGENIKVTLKIDEKDWSDFARDYDIRINTKLLVMIDTVQTKLSDYEEGTR